MKWPQSPYSYDLSQSLTFGCSFTHEPTKDGWIDWGVPLDLSDIPDPSGVIYIYELDSLCTFPNDMAYSAKTDKRIPSVDTNGKIFKLDVSRLLPIWHHGGGNWLFGDGHVRWMKPRQTLTPKLRWLRYQGVVAQEFRFLDMNPTNVTWLLRLMDQYPELR